MALTKALMLSIGYEDHPLNHRFTRNGEMACWTLEYLCAGHVSATSTKGQFLHETGSAMLVPPFTPYSIEWAGGDGDWQEIYVIFDPLSHWTPWLSWPKSDCGLGIINLPNPTATAEIETALFSAFEIQLSARANRHALYYNAFEKALLALDEFNPHRGYTQRDERIEQALAYIALHYAEPLDLAILAREVYLSPSRFSHLFRIQMQQSPMQYVEQYRLERASEKLLSGQDSIDEVATTVGFINPFHFSTRFRGHFGQSPSRYRRNPK